MPWNQDPGEIWYFALFKSMTWYSDGSLKTQQWHGEHISKQLACVRTAILSHNFEHWQYKILTELPGLTVFSVGVTCCYRLTVTWAPTMTPVTTNTTPTWWYYRLYIQHLPPLQSPFIHTLQRSLSAHASYAQQASPALTAPQHGHLPTPGVELLIASAYGVPQLSLPVFQSGLESDFALLKMALNLLSSCGHLSEQYKHSTTCCSVSWSSPVHCSFQRLTCTTQNHLLQIYRHFKKSMASQDSLFSPSWVPS